MKTRNKVEDVLVSPNAPILDAIRIIDLSEVMIAIVVDDDKKLVGTVTDGDVRRGILKGIDLKEPIRRVMNPKPRWARSGEDRQKIIEKMQKELVLQIPILDMKDRVVGLEIMSDFLKPVDRPNRVVLMAGGLGSRLMPLTEETPKPLLEVGQKPILETILENFIEHGFKRFSISVNYKNEMLREYFGNGTPWKVEIDYLQEDERLGTAGALSLLEEDPAETVMVMNGDLLTKVDFSHFLRFHEEHRAQATMAVREYDFQVPYGVVRTEKQAILSIDEKPVQRFFVNAGIYALEPAALKFVPKKAHFNMPELFQTLIRKKLQTAAFPVREYWLDIGQIEDFKRANGEYSEHFRLAEKK